MWGPGVACRPPHGRPRGVLVPRTALARDLMRRVIEHISRDNVRRRCEWANGGPHRARSGREQTMRPGRRHGRRTAEVGGSIGFPVFETRKIVVYRLKIGRPTVRGAVTSELRRGDLRSSKFEDGNTNYKTSP